MSVFLSLFLLFSNFSVKANEIVFPAFPEPVEGKSSTHYLISFDSEDNTYYLLKPLNPQNIYVSYSNGQKVFKFTGPAISYSWTGEGDTTWNKRLECNSSTNLIIPDTREFLYSSFDVFYDDGSLFFQRAPIKANFLTQMREVEMGAIMTTVVFLIPLLILSLISLMGFRKAWAWLSKVLRKS